jgi:hypothetical protein
MAATAPNPTAPASADLNTAMASVSLSPADASLSPTTALHPAVRLSVPLDAQPIATDAAASSSGKYPVRKLVRRDSMERREALLKGKEGSRQRRRWENGE